MIFFPYFKLFTIKNIMIWIIVIFKITSIYKYWIIIIEIIFL